MLSLTQVQIQHSFYKNSPPPSWQPMLSMTQIQLQHSFIKFFPAPPPCVMVEKSTDFVPWESSMHIRFHVQIFRLFENQIRAEFMTHAWQV